MSWWDLFNRCRVDQQVDFIDLPRPIFKS